MLFGRGGGRRRKRRRSAWPFFTHIINTLPPPVPASLSAGGPLTDVQALIAALGGDAVVPAFYDARSRVTVASWQDVRGAGFGPVLTATGTPVLSGSGATARVTTSGTQWYQSALSPIFDLSHAGTLVLFATLADASNILGGIGVVSNNPNMVFWPQSGDAAGFYEPAGQHITFGGGTIPNAPSVQPCDGRLYAVMVAIDGSKASTLVCWPGQVTATTLTTAMTAGNALFSIGADPGHAVPASASFAGAMYLNRAFTASDAKLIGQFAFNAYGAFNDALRMFVCHGDSLSLGFNLSDLSQNYPSQIIATAPFQTQWATVNGGLAGQTVPQMITSALTVVDPIFEPGRVENVVCIWGGTNDIISGAAAATVFANLQTYVNARRAVGWKVVILTCIDRTTINETTRAAYNALITSTYGGGAVAGVAVADVASNANIGANGANTNLTYFMADGIHLTAAGYAIVAPLVSSAITSIL